MSAEFILEAVLVLTFLVGYAIGRVTQLTKQLK